MTTFYATRKPSREDSMKRKKVYAMFSINMMSLITPFNNAGRTSLTATKTKMTKKKTHA